MNVRRLTDLKLSWLFLIAWLFASLPSGFAAETLVGAVEKIRPAASNELDLELVSGTNRIGITVQDAEGRSPTLYSRIQAPSQTVSGWKDVQQWTGLMQPLARTAADLREMGAAGQHVGCVADLYGQVLGASPDGKSLALADETGVALLNIQRGVVIPKPGQQIHIQGNCTVEGPQTFFQSSPLVDNNGIHAMREKSGDIYLTVGWHSLRLDWFNRQVPYGLEVYVAGPGLPKERIADSELFFLETNSETGQPFWTNGVKYKSYEGDWLRVPDFSRLQFAAEGITSNFVPEIGTRRENIGVEFKTHLQIPREGLYTFSIVSDDGSLLFIDGQPQSIEVLGSARRAHTATVTPLQLIPDDREIGWAMVEGKITFASERAGQIELELSSETGRMRVEIADSGGLNVEDLSNRRVRVTGIALGGETSDGKNAVIAMLSPGRDQVEFWEPATRRWIESPIPVSGAISASLELPKKLPVLTGVEQVKQLTREQSQRGYPVKLRGIITTVLDSGIFIQDSSQSIYARWKSASERDVPRVGDYWEIEGKTFAEFAPNILVSHASRLGSGALPQPLHPSWDQLINGSLDTEYVEIQGMITAASANGLTLRTREGTLAVDLIDLQPQAVQRFTNALVRLRGCIIPVRDIHTQQVEPGRIRLSNAAITADELPPADPFAVPLKRASDLLMFDPRAGAFQRVKIAGQFLHEQNGVYFLMDGNDGLRFIPKVRFRLKPGALVDVVGFLELTGPSPILQEAIARQIGSADLPKPKILSADALLDRQYDATLVEVQARLIDTSQDSFGHVLELQAGKRDFLARLKRLDGPLPDLDPGSLLQLTGVYAGEGIDPSSGGEITSFELLLNSGDDIKLLARPPWWTLERALLVASGLMLVLAIGLVWIALLRRQVEERSQQLTAEIRRHEQTERQRDLEAERARIARDLHDDLGAALTQIRFLSAVESRDTRAPDATRSRMEQVSEKSREMVASLDEIVWAVDPANDSAASLASYLCHFAEEFFRVTEIRCRLDVADDLPSAPLTSEVRHHLYLAVREALNNIAKHSGATEVWLRIHASDATLRISVEDNGRGAATTPNSHFSRGLTNMRERLETIGGRFEFQSKPGAGANCRFFVPLHLGTLAPTLAEP